MDHQAERISGPPVTSEADHFEKCRVCGEVFDMRDLGQAAEHFHFTGPVVVEVMDA